jgi:hypothetical protein
MQCQTRNEYIEICNRGGAPVNLMGWRIFADKALSIFYFPSYALDSGASVFVHSGPDAPATKDNHLLWTDRYIWDNFEDRAILYNQFDEIVEMRVCTPPPTPTP